ncbi:MAG: glycosyltransferase family 4 protein [Nitrososphaeria archaeon]
MSRFVNTINIISVATPSPFTGGDYRALLAIKEYKKRGVNPFLVLPWALNFNVHEKRKYVTFLQKEGIKVYGSAELPKIFSLNLPVKKSLAQLLISNHLLNIKLDIKDDFISKSHCVMSMHEVIDALTTTSIIGEKFSLKRIALLQSPPFYEDKERFNKIREAKRLWFNLIYDKSLLSSTWDIIDDKFSYNKFKTLRLLLKNFDMIITVSKSISIEMGVDWLDKIVSLDPGVALSKEDSDLINKISNRAVEKDNIIVFGGRPSAEKGIIEALIAWKYILKSVGQNYKLIVTGNIQPKIMVKLKTLSKSLGIGDNVLFTGFIPKDERLYIVAKARMMIYPSHSDAYPYAVLEAINLSTPVVAYDIPALKVNFGHLSGVNLVKESDVDALVQKSIEIIKGRNIFVEKYRFNKDWDKIMDEETNLIRNLS